MPENPEPLRQAPHFEEEFPGASRSASEFAINVVRTTGLFLSELDRRRKTLADLSDSAWQVLGVVEGAGGPLPPNVIAERLLITSGSMTSLLDTLERRGLVVRTPHPGDRRKLLVEITDEARDLVNRVLPIVHSTTAEMMEGVAEADRDVALRVLAHVRAGLEAMAARPVPPVTMPRRKVRQVR